MKKITTNILSLSLLLLLNGCSSTHDIVSMSNSHEYNSNYGLVQNHMVDTHIQEELWSENSPIEVETEVSNPEWTTELVLDPDAVTAEEYVETPEVITYKYKFDPKFYDEAEWRSNE